MSVPAPAAVLAVALACTAFLPGFGVRVTASLAATAAVGVWVVVKGPGRAFRRALAGAPA